jgi:hypothetical protein
MKTYCKIGPQSKPSLLIVVSGLRVNISWIESRFGAPELLVFKIFENYLYVFQKIIKFIT